MLRSPTSLRVFSADVCGSRLNCILNICRYAVPFDSSCDDGKGAGYEAPQGDYERATYKRDTGTGSSSGGGGYEAAQGDYDPGLYKHDNGTAGGYEAAQGDYDPGLYKHDNGPADGYEAAQGDYDPDVREKKAIAVGAAGSNILYAVPMEEGSDETLPRLPPSALHAQEQTESSI